MQSLRLSPQFSFSSLSGKYSVLGLNMKRSGAVNSGNKPQIVRVEAHLGELLLCCHQHHFHVLSQKERCEMC